jgi:hypothetical protein
MSSTSEMSELPVWREVGWRYFQVGVKSDGDTSKLDGDGVKPDGKPEPPYGLAHRGPSGRARTIFTCVLEPLEIM